MKLIINRILFSLYCLENSISFFLDNFVYKRLITCFCKFWYKYDIFGNLHKNHFSYYEYINHTFSSAKEAAKNEDYGVNITNAMGLLCIVIFSFINFLLFLVEYYFLSPTDKIGCMPLIIISLGLSYIMCFLFSFSNNKYKVYFTKFKSSRCNKTWHIITALICCLAFTVLLVTFKFMVVSNQQNIIGTIN